MCDHMYGMYVYIYIHTLNCTHSIHIEKKTHKQLVCLVVAITPTCFGSGEHLDHSQMPGYSPRHPKLGQYISWANHDCWGMVLSCTFTIVAKISRYIPRYPHRSGAFHPQYPTKISLD